VLLEKPASFTETEPLVVLAGTLTVMLASLQAVGVAAMPLNNTWLPLEFVPKPEPLKVTVPPMGAAGGVKLVITGLIAVNVATGTLAIEFTVTLTGPGPEGTAAGTTNTICESLQLLGEEVIPEFRERHEARRAKKNAELAPYIEQALSRVVPPESIDPPVVESYPRFWNKQGMTEQQIGLRRALDAGSLWRLHIGGGSKDEQKVPS